MRRRLSLLPALLLASVAASPASAGTVTTLFAFDNTNGATPTDGPAIDAAGNAYVALAEGGQQCLLNIQGCGTLDKLRQGAAVTLVRFNGSNGLEPSGPVTLRGQTLYGATLLGPGTAGTGVVYRVKTDGTGFAILHAFSAQDGSGPNGGLIVATDGTVYGVATNGGPFGGGASGYGTLFKIAPDGTFATLHNFTGGADGGFPSTLVMDSAGNLYGATSSGSFFGSDAAATLYRYATASGTFTVLHSYSASLPTVPSLGGVTPDGVVYGASSRGGLSGQGSLFVLRPGAANPYTDIYSFGSAASGRPTTPPVLTADGALVGVTAQVLYSFKNHVYQPLAAFSTNVNSTAPSDVNGPPLVLQGGQVLGTSAFGGQQNCGFGGTTCGTLWLYTP
jgi:uncharacterized repeat protein (TIGR03803 family)